MSNEITKAQAQERFLSLVRGVAQTWAGLEVSSELERCNGVVLSILNIIDGTTGVFPALDLVVRPHPTDKAHRIGNGQNYYPDGLAINDDRVLHELFHGSPDEAAMLSPNGPRAYTKVEIRAHVLDVMRDYAHYWAALPSRTPLERCTGGGFALLNIFDGTTTEVPSFDLVTRPHANARECDVAKSRDYFPTGMAINQDACLHGSYYEQ
jgi:hypothetical protein